MIKGRLAVGFKSSRMLIRRPIARNRAFSGPLLCIAFLLMAAQEVHAQSGVLNTNLIVNGNAEAGPAGMDVKTPVSSIPGWTVTGGKPTVLPYNLTGFVQITDPTPPDHGFQ